jgi:hypothetical protein
MAITTDDTEEADDNPYLALRAAKIARNQARLEELGLSKPTPLPIIRTNAAAKSKRHDNDNNNNNSKKKSSTTTKQPIRRSRRLSEQPEQPDNEETEEAKSSLVVHPKRKRTRPPSSSSSPVPPAANSVRSIDLDTEALVLGEKGILGISMERTGKEFVIYESFALAASTEEQDRLQGSRLSFNKYCGVQEWRNSIFLWVNLGNKDNNPVVNDFLEDAKQITWFGGSRMHDESPVIHKLIQRGKEATALSSRIVLWCRKYQRDIKQFTPYVCFGRLAYHSHVPESQPLAFVWNLLDSEAFQNHSDPLVRARFQEFTK